MKETNKKQGRKFNREKWDWDELESIKPSNAEIIERFEAFLKDQEAKEHNKGMEQGRSKARRESTERVLAWAFVLGSSFIIGGWLVVLVIKFINLTNIIA